MRSFFRLFLAVGLLGAVFGAGGPSSGLASDRSVVGQLAPPPAGEQEAASRSLTPEEAFALLTQRAREGRPEAMYDLAGLYDRGVGTPRNFTEALRWYERAAEKESGAAHYQAGLAYELGKGAAADRRRALTHYQKSAALKFPEAASKLAVLALAAAPPSDAALQKALEHLRSAGQNAAQAQETLGSFFEQGLGVSPNYTLALNWYEKAAQAGRPSAYFRLGNCYELGLGAAADPQKSLAGYLKAAELKFPEASYKLAARQIEAGDQKKAVDYLHQAADNGHSGAANELGVVYLEGRLGQAVNPSRALDMFVKSAELGNANAMKNVAVIFRNGLGRNPDPGKALKWYLIAQAGGYRTDNLEEVQKQLRDQLSVAEVKKAEDEARAWLNDFPRTRP